MTIPEEGNVSFLMKLLAKTEYLSFIGCVIHNSLKYGGEKNEKIQY